MIKKVESPGKKRGRPPSLPRLGERETFPPELSLRGNYTPRGEISARPTFRPVFSRINREFFLLLLLLLFFSLRMKPRYLVSHGLLYGQKGL